MELGSGTEEMKPTVAYLGPHGTFTEEAAHLLFANLEVQFVPSPTIPNVLNAVQEGRAEYAVVPIENSIEGSVTLTMDWLIHQVDLIIQAELTLPISQQLFAASHRELHEIQKVYTHPQAAAQCRLFLHHDLPHAKIEYTSSTADAVRLIMAQPKQPWAAIGPRLAGSLYRSECLREEIQDHDHNRTRFVLVGKAATPQLQLKEAVQIKTTYVIGLPSDYPGALHQVLSAFAARQINLSKIESRPTKKRLGSYHFILDVERDREDALLAEAVSEVAALGCEVQCFGSYPAYRHEGGVRHDA